jgi:hypothetical protein
MHFESVSVCRALNYIVEVLVPRVHGWMRCADAIQVVAQCPQGRWRPLETVFPENLDTGA